MSTLIEDSSLELIFAPIQTPSPAAPQASAAREFPLDGPLDLSVQTFPCPECGCPMTVRLWLMTADCWRCATSIELTLEQEMELRRRMAARPGAEAKLAPPGVIREERFAPVRPEPRAKSQADFRHAETQPLDRPPSPPPPLAPPPPPPTVESVRPRPNLQPVGTLELSHPHRTLNDITAWIVSAVFHALLIILLGLWTFGDEGESPLIVLSVEISPLHREGGDLAEIAFNENDFELPVSEKPKNRKERDALIKADQEARELRLDPYDQPRSLPAIARVKADLASSDPYRRMHAARDPRLRAEIVRREGGTTLTEAAVSRALRWMAAHQNEDGSWSIDGFNRVHECRGQCNGHASLRSDSGGTALVLMAMLGTGQTHKTGIYRDEIERGLAWLVRNQKPDGDLRTNSSGISPMYAHGQAAIALCEAFKLTGDETLRAPAQKAIDFICAAQHSGGGWRYEPRVQPGDTSVVGWQLMALQSAKSAYLRVPQENMSRADDFLDTVQADDEGGLYSYLPHNSATPAMTAEGLLSRMYLGWTKTNPGLEVGVEHLIEKHLPDNRRRDMYYWYYGTQVMHHWGGEPWERWNIAIRDMLVKSQRTSGHAAGSWDPHPADRHDKTGGRLYVTALAACTLEVYYRQAPLYKQLDLD